MRIIRGLSVLAVVLGILVSPVATAQSEWLSLPGASDMVIRGDYAYIRGLRPEGNDVLYIVDLLDMRLVSETPSTAEIMYQLMTLGDSYVITQEGSTNVVYDVSNPESPEIVNILSRNGGGYVASDSYLYYIGEGRFQVFDASNPAELTLLGETSIPPGTGGTFTRLSDGYIAFNIHIFDVRDPANPVLLDSTLPSLPAGTGPYSQHLPVVVGNYLYRAIFKEQERTPYVRTVDISNPASPLELDSVPLPSDSRWGKLVTDGTHLYFGYEIWRQGNEIWRQGKWVQAYSAGRGIPRKLGPPIEVDRLSEYLSAVDRTLYIGHFDFGFGRLRIPLSAYYNVRMPVIRR